jgi:hypothetical protein
MGILDVLSKGANSILVFDFEFWHVKYENTPNIHAVKNQSYYFIPREIGGIVLKKDKSWKIHDKFFVTLNSPVKNVSLPLGKYASLSDDTAMKLSELQSKVDIPFGELFFSELDSRTRPIWKETIHLYENDSNIKKHNKPLSWLTHFMKIYSSSTVIIKGSNDIHALKNICHIAGVRYRQPTAIIDIVDWNDESHKLCGSAKLGDTYRCIEDDLSPEIKNIQRDLDFVEEHSPLTDASMTLIIAMYSVA